MKLKQIVITTIFLLPIFAATDGQAQQAVNVDEILARIDEIIKEAIQSQVSTLVLISGQPDIGLGSQKLGEDNPVRFKTLQIPIRKEYKRSNNNALTLDGLLGVSTAVENVNFDEPELDRSKFKSFLVSAGAGYRFYLSDSFYLWPKMAASYANIKNRHQYKSQFSIDNIRPLLEGRGTNWSIDALSINPSLEAKYSHTAGDYKYGIRSTVNLNWIKTTNVDSDLQRLHTNSHFWINTLSVGRVVDWKIADKPVFLEGQLSRVQLFGDADDALGTSYINRIGGRVLFHTKSKIDWLKRISFDFSYSFGKNFEGVNVGFSLHH